MKQGEDEKPKTRKRQISIITVFLWIFLIVTMVAITATGMKNQNALEGDDTTSVEIIKNWMGMEPSSYEVPSITLQVKDGKKVVAEHDVTSADNWRYTFTNLPKYREDGTEIHYTVGEAEEFIELADGYYSLDRIEGNTIYNGFTFKVSGGTKDDYITITKKWNDNNNELGLRPESVVVRLTGIAAFSGTVELNERIELSEKNDWSYTFCNRGVLRDIPVNYTVEEESTNTSYECNVSGGQTGYNDIWSFEITNTLNVPKIETTSVEVIKDWMGRKPSIDDVPSITLQVKDGETVVAEHKVTSADNWRYTFTDLPKYRADGTEINYTVGEVETLIYAKNGFFYLDRIEGNIIYNAFRVEGGPAPENHYIYIKKIWNDNNNELGLRPENVKIKVKSSAGFQSEELELNEENNWYAYIVNRGVYSYQKHKYTVDEEYESELYQSDIQVEQNDYSNVINITITNTLMVPDEKVQIEVMKTWDDNDN
ncbi:MAG: Cna B-type domain-containing protein, partial [Clostridia bacterium]|nr:Cna B-type domain-containing protein [Clostridia bacterium]